MHLVWELTVKCSGKLGSGWHFHFQRHCAGSAGSKPPGGVLHWLAGPLLPLRTLSFPTPPLLFLSSTFPRESLCRLVSAWLTTHGSRTSYTHTCLLCKYFLCSLQVRTYFLGDVDLNWMITILCLFKTTEASFQILETFAFKISKLDVKGSFGVRGWMAV